MAEIGTTLLSAVLRYLAPYPGANPLLCDPNSTSWVFDIKIYKYNRPNTNSPTCTFQKNKI